ncbi:MAG: inositol-3-phosphate synthase [Gluconacetobacter diazotrophicus]|nr:inositol-3-phosphate synthase [Gluconacetobacter diazotrophicus]
MASEHGIRIALAGVGNCASALVQGLHHYAAQHNEGAAIGLMHESVGGYRPGDIGVVAAFDIDERKVGRDVNEAIFAPPNCVTPIAPDLPVSGVTVQMGRVLDGLSEHMEDVREGRSFRRSAAREQDKAEIVAELKRSGAQMLVNYLPVGSEEATRFYAECALEAGIGFINNIPVFIASDPDFAGRFAEAGLPLVGDDIKSQVGATIVHRVLTDLFKRRGVKLMRTYQLNTGGNTDFLNMKNQERLKSKKVSKTEAVQAVAARRMEDENIHVGPSDYVPWQNDNKVAFIRMEGRAFGDVPLELELRLSVQDSPNSAGVAIDMIRCCRLALDRGIGGVLGGPSAYFCKHPPVQYSDDDAYSLVESFIDDSEVDPRIVPLAANA